jgi:hypothetical protein
MMSRVVDRRRVFDDGEKELFRKTMRAVEGFSGAQILTWTALENPISAKSGWLPCNSRVMRQLQQWFSCCSSIGSGDLSALDGRFGYFFPVYLDFSACVVPPDAQVYVSN